MDSHDTSDAVDHGLANERWLTIYKYYLTVAVAFSVIGLVTGLARFIEVMSGQVSASALVGASIWGVAQTGLFVFALWSLRRVDENWVRTLQLSINGVAVVMVIIRFLLPYSFNIFIQVGSIFIFPIAGVIPWQLVNELQLDSLLIRWAIPIALLPFAAYFFFRWLKLAGPTPVMAADSQNTTLPAGEQQTDPWRKHRVGAGILTVLLGLLLGVFGLAFGQQMAFLSGVMSGVGPSAITIPLPVVAIVVGIIVGGLMFCGERGWGRPMVWLAAVTAPLLAISLSFREVFLLIVLATSVYLIWVLRNTVPAKEGR